MGQPKRIVDAKILIANTPMDTDKVKIYGARVRVDSMAKARCLPPRRAARLRRQSRLLLAAALHPPLRAALQPIKPSNNPSSNPSNPEQPTKP